MGSSLAGATAAIFAGMGNDFGDDAPCEAVVEAPIEYVPQATVPAPTVPVVPPSDLQPIVGPDKPVGRWMAVAPRIVPSPPPAHTTRAVMGKPSVSTPRSTKDEEAKARDALAKAKLEKSL